MADDDALGADCLECVFKPVQFDDARAPDIRAIPERAARRDDADFDGFFVGGMIPTCISDDRDAAAAVMRRTLTGYVGLPNYRNYWKQSGYREEMEAIEAAQAAGDHDAVPSLMTDRWLRDCTLHGPAEEVRAGLQEWYDTGLTTPILVPSSVNGGQMTAFEEVFAFFHT